MTTVYSHGKEQTLDEFMAEAFATIDAKHAEHKAEARGCPYCAFDDAFLEALKGTEQ